MSEAPEVLNVKEASRFLHVSGWTIRELARQGRIPARKVGKEWRFSRDALLVWLAGGSSGAVTEATIDHVLEVVEQLFAAYVVDGPDDGLGDLDDA